MTPKNDPVREFHEKFNVPVASHPTVPPIERRALRAELIREEFKEFQTASREGDIVQAADALADLLYVVYGAALEWGIPLDAVFQEVHRSNMTKLWPDGLPHCRDDGKILKPPGYSPADVSGVISRFKPAQKTPANT